MKKKGLDVFYSHESVSLAIATIIFVAAYFFYVPKYINHDAAWLIYAAKGVLSGKALYKDLIEVNAPMACLIMIPTALLSNLVSNEAALIISMLGFVAISFGLCLPITKHMELGTIERELLHTTLLLVMIFLPQFAFAEREQIFVILVIPYLLASSLRDIPKPLPRAILIACGIAAAFATSVKPQFMLIIAIVELVLLIKRGWKIRFTADLITFIAATITIYTLSLAAYPIYITTVIPWAAELYNAYGGVWILEFPLFLLLVLLFIAAAAGKYQGKTPMAHARLVYASAAFSAIAVFVIQSKGWPYHMIPAWSFLAVFFALNLMGSAEDIRNNAHTGILRTAISAIALLATVYMSSMSDNQNPSMAHDVDARVRKAGGSFYIFSTGNYPGFPIALAPGYTWGSRWPQLLMLPGIVRAEMEGKSSQWEPWFRESILEDLKQSKPAVIFVFEGSDIGLPQNFDILTWFLRDSKFRDEWQRHYQTDGYVSLFTVYKRIP